MTEVPESCLLTSEETVEALKPEKSALGIVNNVIILIINTNNTAEIRNAPRQKERTDFLTKAAGQTVLVL